MDNPLNLFELAILNCELAEAWLDTCIQELNTCLARLDKTLDNISEAKDVINPPA